jgi:hypothetical protein
MMYEWGKENSVYMIAEKAIQEAEKQYARAEKAEADRAELLDMVKLYNTLLHEYFTPDELVLTYCCLSQAMSESGALIARLTGETK